ncbi:DUF6683 family protein [Erythrobacter sp. R86502]|uniref:DUF6683 family protein n=1 Tax=Erythrobacter sp. R86502 TaxID=3093846 RepID=UPI0036D3C679
MQRGIAFCAAIVLAIGSSASHAQSMPWINPQVLSTTTGTDVMSIVLQERTATGGESDEEAALGSAKGLTATGRQDAGQAAAVDYRYRYSPARTQQNLRSFLARAPNPAARAELEQMFAAQPMLMDDIRAGIQPYGLDSHNVADAFAMWWIMAWLASEVRMQEPNREMAQNVSRQVRNAFATTSDFASTNDAIRQEYAEALLLQALILAELIKAAGANPEIKAQLPAIAQKDAKVSGIDLSQMNLTQSGIVPRKTK